MTIPSILAAKSSKSFIYIAQGGSLLIFEDQKLTKKFSKIELKIPAKSIICDAVYVPRTQEYLIYASNHAIFSIRQFGGCGGEIDFESILMKKACLWGTFGSYLRLGFNERALIFIEKDMSIKLLKLRYFDKKRPSQASICSLQGLKGTNQQISDFGIIGKKLRDKILILTQTGLLYTYWYDLTKERLIVMKTFDLNLKNSQKSPNLENFSPFKLRVCSSDPSLIAIILGQRGLQSVSQHSQQSSQLTKIQILKFSEKRFSRPRSRSQHKRTPRLPSIDANRLFEVKSEAVLEAEKERFKWIKFLRYKDDSWLICCLGFSEQTDLSVFLMKKDSGGQLLLIRNLAKRLSKGKAVKLIKAPKSGQEDGRERRVQLYSSCEGGGLLKFDLSVLKR